MLKRRRRNKGILNMKHATDTTGFCAQDACRFRNQSAKLYQYSQSGAACEDLFTHGLQ